MSETRMQNIENNVLAVMTSETEVQEAVIDLERNGFEREGIRVFHPGEASEKLDPTAEHSGLLGKIARSIQGALSDEYKLLEEYEEAASQGMEVIAVHVYKAEQAETAKDILEAHNADNIRYFGSWAVTDLQDQGRATS